MGGEMNESVARRTGLRLLLYALYALLLLAVALVRPESSWVVVTFTQVAVTFAAMSLVPGLVLLFCFDVTVSTYSRALIYAVGISLPYVLLSIILVDTGLSLFGIHLPFTSGHLAGIVVLVTLVPYALGVLRGSSLRVEATPRLERWYVDIVPTAFLASLPVLAILGAYVSNNYNFSFTIVLALILVAVVPYLIAVEWVPRRLLPLAVLSVALAVLFHANLITDHLWGWDIHYEYYTARVIQNQGWNLGLETRYNTLPIATLLASVYSTIAGIDIVWIYKVFYPVLASLIPLSIYEFVRSFMDDRRGARWGALSSFVYVFYYAFLKNMPDKQALAEFYFVVLLLILFDQLVRGSEKRALLALASVGLVFAHYAVSFFFLLFAVFTVVTTTVSHRVEILPNRSGRRVFTPAFTTSLAVLWVGWFALVSDGTIIQTAIEQFVQTFLNVSDIFGSRSGADYASSSLQSPLWLVYALLVGGMLGLIGFGVLGRLKTVAESQDDYDLEFMAFTIGVSGFLGVSFAFTFGMGFDRTLRIALIVLSPYALVGVQLLTTGLRRVVGTVDLATVFARTSLVFAVFLGVYFLFSSGVAFAVAGHDVPPYSIALDEDAGWPTYHENEVAASRWLEQETPADSEGVALYNRWKTIKSKDGLLIAEVIDRDIITPIWSSRTDRGDARYVFVSEKPLTKRGSNTEYIDPKATPFYDTVLADANVVYDSGRATVYLVTEPENESRSERRTAGGTLRGDRRNRPTLTLP